MPEAAGSATPDDGLDPHRFAITSADVVDVFVYVVVLNLAVEYVPSVLSESFTTSLLTALLLKVVLELVLLVKKRIVGRMKASTSPTGRVVAAVLLWAVLVGSKFLVLTLEDLIFGDRVELGGFFAVTGLIVTLMVCRLGMRWLLTRLPPPALHRRGTDPTGATTDFRSSGPGS